MVIKSEREFKRALNKYKRENPNWDQVIQNELPYVYTEKVKEPERHVGFLEVVSNLMDIFFR